MRGTIARIQSTLEHRDFNPERPRNAHFLTFLVHPENFTNFVRVGTKRAILPKLSSDTSSKPCAQAYWQPG